MNKHLSLNRNKIAVLPRNTLNIQEFSIKFRVKKKLYNKEVVFFLFFIKAQILYQYGILLNIFNH